MATGSGVELRMVDGVWQPRFQHPQEQGGKVGGGGSMTSLNPLRGLQGAGEAMQLPREFSSW